MVAYGLTFDNIGMATTEHGYGVAPHGIKDIIAARKISDWARSKVDYHVDTLILPVVFWSDDFEVNHIKSTTSIWVHTVTVCPPSSFATSSRYTHALALGRKGISHDSILSVIHDDLKELSKVTHMLNSTTNSSIPVIVKFLVIAADRPECASMNHILSHNGNSTT